MRKESQFHNIQIRNLCERVRKKFDSEEVDELLNRVIQRIRRSQSSIGDPSFLDAIGFSQNVLYRVKLINTLH